jgi:hypothetical protein
MKNYVPLPPRLRRALAPAVALACLALPAAIEAKEYCCPCDGGESVTVDERNSMMASMKCSLICSAPVRAESGLPGSRAIGARRGRDHGAAVRIDRLQWRGGGIGRILRRSHRPDSRRRPFIPGRLRRRGQRLERHPPCRRAHRAGGAVILRLARVRNPEPAHRRRLSASTGARRSSVRQVCRG